MNNSENPEKQNIENAMLKENELLRQEIHHVDTIRFYILVFTVPAIGAIIGLIADRVPRRIPSNGTIEIDYFVFGLSVFALLLLIASQRFTIYCSQRIRITGSYIKHYIESKINGLNWETKFSQIRELRILGTSRPLAFFYFLLSVAVFSFSVVANPAYWFWRYGISTVVLCHYIVIILLFLASLYYSRDSWSHTSKGWHFEWSSETDVTSSGFEAQRNKK